MSTKIKINYDEQVYEYDDSYDPEDAWDRPDTHRDHAIFDFEIGKYFDVVVDFDVEPKKDYYLLYVVYDTGDSFGRDEGILEFIGLYEDRTIAEINKKKALNTSGFSVKLLNSTGEREYDQHVPWNGYFEHLQSMIIETIQMKV